MTDALLASVAAESLACGENVLRIDLFREPTIEAALNRTLIDRHEHSDGSCMGRLLHRENLFRGFTMEWNERWLAGGRPAGVISFETPYGPVNIDANGLALPQSTLLGLLFGFMSVTDACVNDEVAVLAETLFPRTASVYYGADGF